MKPRLMGRTEAEVVPALQQMVGCCPYTLKRNDRFDSGTLQVLEAGNSDAVTVGLLYAVLTEDALNPQAVRSGSGRNFSTEGADTCLDAL